MVTLNPAEPLDDAFRGAVAEALAEWLGSQRTRLLEMSPALAPLADAAETFLAGGKRLRPAFCVWARVAVAGLPLDLAALVRAAASLDVLHVSALVHDDVVDASDTRRGLPSAHRRFEAAHRDDGRRGSAEAFGRAAAILLGDLLLVWSAELFEGSGLDAAAVGRARPLLEAVRTEVTAGQFLDVLIQTRDPHALTRSPDGVDRLLTDVATVVTYKSAAYSVQRPLNIGAAIGDATPAQQDALTAFGRPLGRAFQWRDDVLGVFGDGALTGKDTGEDLREGKLTLLVAHAFASARPAAARKLSSVFGRPDLGPEDVDAARSIIAESGALDLVERDIEREQAAAVAALTAADLTDEGRTALLALAKAAVRRSF